MYPDPRHPVLGVVCTAFLISCGGGSDTNTPSKTMTRQAGDNQSATTGAAVATAPAVKIVDQDNQPVANISVTFAVASGGGSVTGATATTGSNGIAAVGSWTLGTTAGENTLTATASGVTGSPLTFTATATQSPPAIVNVFSGNNQTAVAGTALPAPIGVTVLDAVGTPVSGVSVVFAVATGGGSLVNATSTTNSSGVAIGGPWTLGPVAGTNTLTATVSGSGIVGNPVTFTATGTSAAFTPSSSTHGLPGHSLRYNATGNVSGGIP